MLLNIFGAADRAAAHNRRGRGDPSREPGNHPVGDSVGEIARRGTQIAVRAQGRGHRWMLR